jgi:hypothetical protein
MRRRGTMMNPQLKSSQKYAQGRNGREDPSSVTPTPTRCGGRERQPPRHCHSQSPNNRRFKSRCGYLRTRAHPHRQMKVGARYGRSLRVMQSYGPTLMSPTPHGTRTTRTSLMRCTPQPPTPTADGTTSRAGSASNGSVNTGRRYGCWMRKLLHRLTRGARCSRSQWARASSGPTRTYPHTCGMKPTQTSSTPRTPGLPTEMDDGITSHDGSAATGSESFGHRCHRRHTPTPTSPPRTQRRSLPGSNHNCGDVGRSFLRSSTRPSAYGHRPRHLADRQPHRLRQQCRANGVTCRCSSRQTPSVARSVTENFTAHR